MQAQYLLRVKSEDLTVYARETGEWESGEKVEYNLRVDSEDNTLNFGDIDNIRLFMIHSDIPVEVDFVQGTDTVTFEVQDLLVFSPTVEFTGSLTGVVVRSLGGEATVKIGIYGEST